MTTLATIVALALMPITTPTPPSVTIADGFLTPEISTVAPLEVSLATQPELKRIPIPGNSYAPGNCTYGAKTMRPDLPNDLGNANTWGVIAAQHGYEVSTVPQADAVAVSTVIQPYGHVAYVNSVNPDGSVNITEENWKGLGVISSRTTPASEWQAYIY